MKSHQRTRISFTRGVFEALGGAQFDGRVEPFMLTLESNVVSGPHFIVHSEHQFVFCLRNELDYRVQKENCHVIPGASLLFSANLKHKWKNCDECPDHHCRVCGRGTAERDALEEE